MFSPKKLPCTAWYVTGTLNVRECKVTGRYNGNSPSWFITSSGQKGAGNLFATRDEAIAEAAKRVQDLHNAYVAAGQRWAKADAVVRGLLKGGA